MDQQAADSTGCASPSLFLVRHIFCVQLTCTTDVSSCASREVQLQKIQWSKSNNSASSETHYSFYNSVFWANLGFEVTVMWIRGSSAYPKIMLIFKIWRKNLQIEEVLILLIYLIYLQIGIKSSFEYVLALITWYLTRWWLNRNTRGEQAAQRQTWCHFVFFFHCSLYLWMFPLPQTKVWN